MNDLENRIRQLYSNNSGLIEFIRRINLETPLNQIIDKLDKAVATQNSNKFITLSGIILATINSKISGLTAQEKEMIEFYLADIFENYIKKIATLENGSEIISQIDEQLKDACDAGEYDYNALRSVFNIKKYIIIKPTTFKHKSIYYDWNANLYELDELIKDIYDKKWIYSVKEFKKLFKPVEGSIMVKCNPLYKDHLIILFTILKDRQLIKAKGKGSTGYFAPFVSYAVDNDEKVLFEKPINKVNELLKRNKLRYQEMRAQVESLVTQNVTVKSRQLVDNHTYPLKSA